MNKRFQLKYSLLLFKLLLFLGFIYLFQDKVISHGVSYEITRIQYTYLLLLIPLIFLNWYLEYLKWKIITNVNQLTDTKINQNAFFAGMLGSFLTPSIAGNFLGRIWYYPTALRWKISIHSGLANFSQTLVAIYIGILFLVTSPQQDSITIMYWIMISSMLFLLYLFCRQLLVKLPWQKIRLIGTTLLSAKIRTQFLILSLTRYIVMVAQYCVALLFFGASLSMEYLEPIALVFLFVTITPSLFFGKIIVRESIALTTFSLYALPLNEVFFASLLIWVLSIFIPALLALTFLKAPKLKFT
ncbi:MAG: hypothetical protein ACKO1R_05455 [Crocinitomicaceae bacterium]